MMQHRHISQRDRATVIQAIERLLAHRHEIRWAYLYGSFAESGPYRDIDIAVWIDPAAACSGRLRWYEVELATTLELELRQPVDIRVLNDAPVAFRYHAMAGQPLLVRDPDGLDEMRARTWDDYFDFLPFARRYLREVLNA